MQKLIWYTAILLGPCYAVLLGLVYGLRGVLPDGHVIHEQVDEYLWLPAGVIALALAGLAAALME